MNFSFHQIEKDLYAINKHYVTNKAGHGSDVSGPYWMLIKVKLHNGKIWWNSNGQQINPVSNIFYTFIPQFSWALEHYTANTEIEITGLISKTKLPASYPTQSIVFTSKQKFPQKKSEIANFLKNAKNIATITVCTKPSALSKRAKQLIDRNFQNGIQIKEVADRLKTANAVLSRSFKSDFGNTLAFYRKGLRITVGMYELMMGTAPIEAAQQAGYSDLSRFYKQFKQYLKQTPAEYSHKSKNAKNPLHS